MQLCILTHVQEENVVYITVFNLELKDARGKSEKNSQKSYFLTSKMYSFFIHFNVHHILCKSFSL